MTATLAQALAGADFVVLDGVVFATEYRRVPDEDTAADDVVLEAKHGDDELMLTRAEVEAAEPVAAGCYRLEGGALLHLLSQVTVH